MGITGLRALGITGGKVVPWGSSLGQGFEQVVMGVTIQEGPEGREGGEGEELALGGLGWSRGVCWRGTTRERHLWRARGCFNSEDLGDFTWGQTGVGRGVSLQLLWGDEWGGDINWLPKGEGKEKTV